MYVISFSQVFLIFNASVRQANVTSSYILNIKYFWSGVLWVKKGVNYGLSYTRYILIQEADPQSQPVVIIVFAHVVRPHFSKYTKQNKFQAKTLFTTGQTVDLAEWIIDDTCLVLFMRGKFWPEKHDFLNREVLRKQIMTMAV